MPAFFFIFLKAGGTPALLLKDQKSIIVRTNQPHTVVAILIVVAIVSSLKHYVEAAGGKLRLDVELPDATHYGFSI